jgi:hypothetical protein
MNFKYSLYSQKTHSLWNSTEIQNIAKLINILSWRKLNYISIYCNLISLIYCVPRTEHTYVHSASRVEGRTFKAIIRNVQHSGLCVWKMPLIIKFSFVDFVTKDNFFPSLSNSSWSSSDSHKSLSRLSHTSLISV